jgi:D-glycero-alpha-D-manno-heptose-7-phosphate kinase
MIITRSPLRISLGGGGTDLPSYYKRSGGFLIAAAIDRYVFVNIIRPFSPGIYLKYSKIEHVDTIEDVQHPIIREALRTVPISRPQIEITTLADIPSGTGLGSSGSFTTALIKALHVQYKLPLHPSDLARLACEIEIDRLNEPIGKQDQYIAAYGGITCFEFNADETVNSYPLKISLDTLYDLEDNLLLFFTGYCRSASSILSDQKERSEKSESAMLSNLDYIKDLGYRSKLALESGNCNLFGKLMDEHWEYKKKRTISMSNSHINNLYYIGLNNGAVGGKLVGAGGGGFLLFYAQDRKKLRQAMNKAGLEEVRFRFDFEGTKVLCV